MAATARMPGAGGGSSGGREQEKEEWLKNDYEAALEPTENLKLDGAGMMTLTLRNYPSDHFVAFGFLKKGKMYPTLIWTGL